MKIEAVTVCVGYGDYLDVTAPRLKPIFDRWVIVTTHGDGTTREVCRKYSLPILLTEEFFRDKADFNKGRGVALGLDQIEGSEWIMHVDADILLPPDLAQWLTRAHLEESCIYGMDRVMVPTFDAWKQLRDSHWMQHDFHCRGNFPPGYPTGTRWVSPIHGWVPIGYAQLWHGSADTIHGFHQKPYPSHHGNAARSDVQFALQWDRRKRHLLGEVVAIHLESGPAKLGANWAGRKTPQFGPDHHKPKPHPCPPS